MGPASRTWCTLSLVGGVNQPAMMRQKPMVIRTSAMKVSVNALQQRCIHATRETVVVDWERCKSADFM